MRKNVRICVWKGAMKRNQLSEKGYTILRRTPLKSGNLRKRHYTVPELLGLAGITRKQVDYWVKINLISPVMREAKAMVGRPASYYSAAEVVKAMIISDLKRAGFSLRQIHQVARNLEERGIRLDNSENYLLTDGYSVYFASSDNEVIDILKHHRQMLLLVPVHEQIEKLRLVA
jgi:DNA-binding transcriptional MerR regulator